MFRLIPAILGLLAFSTAALAECTARFDGQNSVILPLYNPFSPADVQSRKTLQIRNLTGDDCQYRVYFRRSPATGLFSDRLRYDLLDDQNKSLFLEDVSPGSARYLLSSPVSGSLSQSIPYSIFVGRGQVTSPGLLVDRIELVLYSEDGGTELDRRDVFAWIAIESISMINLSGGSTGASVPFGKLATGSTRSLILEARSNTQYKISFASSNGGQLRRDGSLSDHGWAVPYRLLVNGTAFHLDQQRTVSGISSVTGLQSYSLTFQITDADAKRAGRYRDIVTVKISPAY